MKLFIEGRGHQDIYIVNTFPTKVLTSNMNVMMTPSLDNNLPRKTPIYVFIKGKKLSVKILRGRFRCIRGFQSQVNFDILAFW